MSRSQSPSQKLMDSCGQRSSIFVYRGKGGGIESSRLFRIALSRAVRRDKHNVEFISPEDVKKGNWISSCSLIVFGGGFDRGFIEALGEEGIRRIREFVHSGGSYLGICAGAYFACDYIEFDKDGPLEVVGARNLKFFPGRCIGPAFPGFQYNTRKGVHAVPLRYKNTEYLDAYMHGGGYFTLPPDSARGGNGMETEILGTYSSLQDNPTAIVKCRVGSGQAILSGVHLEFPSDLLDEKDPDLQSLIPSFHQSERSRAKVFKDLLEQLSVQCTQCDSERYEDFINLSSL